MGWVRQNDPEYLPGWVCEQCGSLVVTADPDAPPPCECRACGAGGDNPSDLATLGHLPLHKGGTPPMAARERLKMPASAEEPDIFTDITGRESIIEGIRRAQVEAERRCIQANAVLINDEMFFSKLPFPPYGEVKMICGLKAFYCPTLPPDVSFAVCEVPPRECDADDNEIIKALKICTSSSNGCSHSNYTCDDCYLKGQPMCSAVLHQETIDLINRQMTKIKRLNSQISRLNQYDEERDIRLHAKLVQKARAEATSEFVEQVKSAFDRYGMEHDCYAIVDEVAKEIGSGAG